MNRHPGEGWDLAIHEGLDPSFRRDNDSKSASFFLANASDYHYYNPMFICICNALREEDILEASTRGDVAHGKRGRGKVGCVYRALGCQPQCGRCVPEVRALVNQISAGD